MRAKRYTIATIVLGLLIFNIACEDEPEGPDEVIAPLEGTWELTALTGTYLRDIALPADWTEADSFSVDAYWDLASTVLGADSALADIHLFAFYEGETLLDSTVAMPNPTALAAIGLAMEVVFKDDGTYTLSGTYPTIRLDEDACRSGLIIAPIEDAGNYTMDYLTGILGVSPDEALGEQVLPPFDDADITFPSDSVMQFNFVDRDAHDERYIEITDTWDEAEERVTMGVADLPVNALGSFDEFGVTTNDTAYIMDAQLAAWGGFMTFYALVVQGEAAYLAGTGIITDAGGDGSVVDDAFGYMFANRATGQTAGSNPIPYALLILDQGVPTNDSGTDFDLVALATNGAGGKLKYVIKAVCIPVNEIIEFESTWSRVTTQ